VASPRGALSPKPLKAFMNLTTLADTLAFSPDGQMLAMSSRMEKDALRVVHLPTRTVFSNWPSSKTPLHYVHSLAFSPHCGYFAVGNARGRVLLYRLTHYDRL
jgi:U3 small nucleolar RNA-associated protein 18